MAACDIQCQRNKELARLSSEFVTATQNKQRDPDAYERARVAYYTYKEGQEWVHTNNQAKATESVQTMVDEYQQKFDAMKTVIDRNAMMEQARQDVRNEQVGDEDEIRFLHSEIEKERNAASVYQRSRELDSFPKDITGWIPSFLDLFLVILGLYLVFQVIVQGKLKNNYNYFSGKNNGVA
jgi:hypothetical protein